MSPNPLPDLDSALAKLGYTAFRPGQREALETLLARRRLLLVAPTGGGKSLTYQLPATLLPGTTLVISPLVSLMNDQVRALEERGVPATFLASTLTGSEMRARMQRIADGHCALVYAAPERLVFPGFRELLRALTVPLVAVDEAHCISHWGHDFRPEYLQIHELLEELPDARVLACTATATPEVRDEILARLGLPGDTPQLVRGFARPNLILRVREVRAQRERPAHVDALLHEALGDPGAPRGVGIVYCPTRAASESEALRLRERGWRAAAYHAGLERGQRHDAQEAFMAGELDVMAATVAFGMGIDRADVRAVVHLAPPGSIEAYYQEVGRAGRDGAAAWGLMLVSSGDMPQRRRLIERGEGTTPESIEHKWNLFLELMRWAEGGSCRHDAILRYFGDEAETLAGCGHCDVCTALGAGGGGGDPEQVTLVVRKALSAVARVNNRFGLMAAVRLLHGTDDPRLERSGLACTPTFGVLKEHTEEWLTRLVRRCVTAGWVDFTAGDRPMLLLTPAGRSVMRAERPARLLLPPRELGHVAGGTQRPRPVAVPDDPSALDEKGQALFEALRQMRLELARKNRCPAYHIASDRTLRALAVSRPRTMSDLLTIYGVGPAKAEQYGQRFLDIVAQSAAP
jgi:ATP-dependent DNA helicase RecQ